MIPEYFQTRFRTDEEFRDWPRQFVIITAHATTGQSWTDERNQSADEELLSYLRKKAKSVRRITGYSPDTGHAEPGWAVELDLESAKELGRRFLQDAVYSVNEGRLFVLKCNGDDNPMFVDEFVKRLD